MNVLQKIIRNLSWVVFSIFPKDKNKVCFTSFYGRGYSDSPKAICEELLKKGGYKLYWNVNCKEAVNSLPKDVKPIKYESIVGIYHMCTAMFWIDNARKYSYVRKSKKQYYIQTWHGFPLKKIEKDAGVKALGEEYIKSAVHDSEMTDLYTSDSAFLTDIYHNGFWYTGKVLQMGIPRNDILINPPEGTEKKVRTALNIDDDVKLLLYAPTFRKDFSLSAYDMDYEAVCNALSERFGGKWLIIIKLHPNIAAKANEMNLDNRVVINASDYSDIHELYIVSNVMITDYSSTMFDFSITRKPCFLFTTDIEAYKNDRDFYFDLEKLPFLRAKNSSQLCDNIKKYDEADSSLKTDIFFQEFGINETGKASEGVVQLIEKYKEKQK